MIYSGARRDGSGLELFALVMAVKERQVEVTQRSVSTVYINQRSDVTVLRRKSITRRSALHLSATMEHDTFVCKTKVGIRYINESCYTPHSM